VASTSLPLLNAQRGERCRERSLSVPKPTSETEAADPGLVPDEINTPCPDPPGTEARLGAEQQGFRQTRAARKFVPYSYPLSGGRSHRRTACSAEARQPEAERLDVSVVRPWQRDPPGRRRAPRHCEVALPVGRGRRRVREAGLARPHWSRCGPGQPLSLIGSVLVADRALDLRIDDTARSIRRPISIRIATGPRASGAELVSLGETPECVEDVCVAVGGAALFVPVVA
jgi:hypothetical protein